MKLRLSLGFTLLALILSAVVVIGAPAAESARPAKGGYPISAAGTTTLNGATVPVTGSFTIKSFKNVNGTITAIGTFLGSINGGPTVSDTGEVPVTAINGTTLGGASTAAAAAQAAGTCQILDLTLGPLHLDLLGLVVDLNQVHLTITAEQGSGNLLGNLLCSVAGLLDNSGGLGGALQNLLNSLTNLLNQILGQL